MHDSLARYPPPLCHPQTREKVLKAMTCIRNNVSCGYIVQLEPESLLFTIAERYKGSRLATSLCNTPDRGVADRTLTLQLATSMISKHSRILNRR
jgi:hypothetical protein